MPGPTLPEPSIPDRQTRTERPFATETHHIMNYWKGLYLFVFMVVQTYPFKSRIFHVLETLNRTPPVTFELKVREQNQLGFWNISITPTSGASFIKISRPTFSTSGTLSQTMTLKKKETAVLVLILSLALICFSYMNKHICWKRNFFTKKLIRDIYLPSHREGFM